ncbi:hypothetical protein MNR05_001331 [Vibrio vulnificus]|nr:hypothetical protein [Vibrio vulnificus]
MKNVQATRSDIKGFVEGLFSNGKSPSERFGVTWKQLSELEKQVPQLTCHSNDKCQKTA